MAGSDAPSIASIGRDQKVLVVPVYGAGGPPPDRQLSSLDQLRQFCEPAGAYFDQVSFGRAAFDFTYLVERLAGRASHLKWLELQQPADFYVAGPRSVGLTMAVLMAHLRRVTAWDGNDLLVPLGIAGLGRFRLDGRRASFRQIGTVRTPAFCGVVRKDAAGRSLYAGHGLGLIRIKSGAAPERFDLGRHVNDIAVVDGTRLFLAEGTAGIGIYDKASLREVSRIATDTPAVGLVPGSRRLIAICSDRFFTIRTGRATGLYTVSAVTMTPEPLCGVFAGSRFLLGSTTGVELFQFLPGSPDMPTSIGRADLPVVTSIALLGGRIVCASLHAGTLASSIPAAGGNFNFRRLAANAPPLLAVDLAVKGTNVVSVELGTGLRVIPTRVPRGVPGRSVVTRVNALAGRGPGSQFGQAITALSSYVRDFTVWPPGPFRGYLFPAEAGATNFPQLLLADLIPKISGALAGMRRPHQPAMTLSEFSLVVIVGVGFSGDGTLGVSDTLTVDNVCGISAETAALRYKALTIGDGESWQTLCHEIGHTITPLRSAEIVGLRHPDTDTARDLCLMGSPEGSAGTYDGVNLSQTTANLLCGPCLYRMGYYADRNVGVFTVTADASKSFRVVEHGLAENADPSRVHLIRIVENPDPASNADWFCVELRHQPASAAAQILFDGRFPQEGAGGSGGRQVIPSRDFGLAVYRVQSDSSHVLNVLNPGDAPTNPIEPLVPRLQPSLAGDKASVTFQAGTKKVTVTAVDRLATDPAMFSVRVDLTLS